LKTWPKQLLGSLPLVIALPELTIWFLHLSFCCYNYFHLIVFVNSCNVCVFYFCILCNIFDLFKATYSIIDDCEWLCISNPYRRGKLGAVVLFVLTSLFQLLLTMQTLFTFLQKQVGAIISLLLYCVYIAMQNLTSLE